MLMSSGSFQLKRRIFLPVENKTPNTYRSVNIDGEEINFSSGFTELHTKVYEEVLAGNGFGIEDARPSVELVYKIRHSLVKINNSPVHPLAKRHLNL